MYQEYQNDIEKLFKRIYQDFDDYLEQNREVAIESGSTACTCFITKEGGNFINLLKIILFI